MNNEPVAEKTSNNGWMVSKEYMDLPVGTLLYTHPAKTLTDEEIVEIINEYKWRGLTGYLLTFARAILRKAQENG